MTFKERFAIQHPSEEWHFDKGGTPGCPHEFGLESEEESRAACHEMRCVDCWDRQMPEPEAAPTNDPVNHPSHYTNGGIECIDAIASALSAHTDPMDAFLTGQILKYMWRWPMKGGVEDLEKAQFYLDRLISKHTTEW